MVEFQKEDVEQKEVDVIENSDQGGEDLNPQSQPVSSEVNVVTSEETPKTIKLDEIEDEQEYSEEEYKQLVDMYENTLEDFVAGELVTGKILAINNKEIAVDIGFKSEGTIPIDEFINPEELQVGDDIEVFLDEVEDKEGQLVLSKKKADFMRIWDKICNSYERGDILQGKCTRRIKGGIVVDLMGVDAFLPGSQIDVRPIRDFDAFIGKTLDLKVVKINNLRKNIVVSRRVLVEAEIAGQRQKILDELEKDQILEGTVKNITDFGVFIDLGGVDGLLHINDLSWGRVSHPSEVVALDEKLKVIVLDFNEAKDRISLGLKQLQPHPWENIEKKYPVGSVMRGKVVSISDYGAFVELEKGVEGLIHISEMSWTQHIKHPSKIVTIGETVEAKILNIEKDERKISLGLKQLEPDPWETLEERYPVGSHHEGKVRNLTNFGAFIELEDGIDGLVHISDLSWTKKIRHPSEVLKKGAKVEVVVLNVDRQNRRISLGFKQTKENPWDSFEETYKVGTVTRGKVVRLIEKGLIVELPDEVDGFVPISHLSKQVNKPSDAYQVDDNLEIKVIEFNKENKKIVLSEKLVQEATEEEIAATAKKEAPGELPSEVETAEKEVAVSKQEAAPEKPVETERAQAIQPEERVESKPEEISQITEKKAEEIPEETEKKVEDIPKETEMKVEAKAEEIPQETEEKAEVKPEEVPQKSEEKIEAKIEEKPQEIEDKPETKPKKRTRKTKKKAETEAEAVSQEVVEKVDTEAPKTAKKTKKKKMEDKADEGSQAAEKKAETEDEHVSAEIAETTKEEVTENEQVEPKKKPKKRTRKTKKTQAETAGASKAKTEPQAETTDTSLKTEEKNADEALPSDEEAKENA